MQRSLYVLCGIFAILTPTAADFKTDALRVHNEYRKKHHAPLLVLNSNLNNIAENCAGRMASTNKLEHSPNMKYGENIYKSTQVASVAVQHATKEWYDKVCAYNFNNVGTSTSKDLQSFAQVLWRDTKNLGIGVAKSASPSYTYVCAIYDPPGKTHTQCSYPLNVIKP